MSHTNGSGQASNVVGRAFARIRDIEAELKFNRDARLAQDAESFWQRLRWLLKGR